MAAAAGARPAGRGAGVRLLDRVRCALLGRPCPAPWAAEHDPLLIELRDRTERANREADALRAAREGGAAGPSYEGLYAPRPAAEGRS